MSNERDNWIGPVGPIRVTEGRTPRMEAASAGMIRAQELRSVDEHLEALRNDPDPWVRAEVVPRLAARGQGDGRTVPALMSALRNDASPVVRDAAAMALWQNADDDRVADAFAHALTDEDEGVRWSAMQGLAQRTA